MPKAQVTVYVAPKKLEKTVTFSVDSQTTVVDKVNNVIPGKAKSVLVSGEKTTSATGTKTVGERSKGKVTILHVGGTVLLKTGTVLTGPNGLKFTLDGDVPVATSTSLINPSKSQSLVVAADIGAQYNLASGSEFSVGNFSKADFVAQNDDSFTGGTSRIVPAISETDRTNLEKELTAELLTKGVENVKKDLLETETAIEGSSAFTSVDKSFSGKTGEESSNLKLSISGNVSTLVISQEDINELIYLALEKDVPEGFTLRHDQVQIEYKAQEQGQITDKETKKKQTDKEEKQASSKVFVAQITANFLPKIDLSEISRSVSGKDPQSARSYLATVPGFIRAEITFNFKFPGKLGTLPRISKNISVEISAER